MQFAHDTEEALRMAAALVNTAVDRTDELADRRGLEDFLDHYPMSGTVRGTNRELLEVQQMREQLDRIWREVASESAPLEGAHRDPERAGLVDRVNELLAATEAKPYLVRHDGYDWHLHVTEPDQPLADRIGAEAAMGFVDLIRAGEAARLKICAAEHCSAVVIDLSKNSSKRFCDTGNCGNRTHVAAYRARKRSTGATRGPSR